MDLCRGEEPDRETGGTYAVGYQYLRSVFLQPAGDIPVGHLRYWSVYRLSKEGDLSPVGMSA